MKETPFELTVELPGWELFLAWTSCGDEEGDGLAALRERVAAECRERFAQPSEVAAHPATAALRRLFRAAGCDPTRYRPSSEALLRRLVKGAELPAIHPLVDVNNCLSAELAVPCCVMADGTLGTRLVFRVGRESESYESLRGPFNLESKPLLVDELGPVDAPITGSKRVMVQPATRGAWLVAYLPEGAVTADQAWSALDKFCGAAGVDADRAPSVRGPC